MKALLRLCCLHSCAFSWCELPRGPDLILVSPNLLASPNLRAHSLSEGLIVVSSPILLASPNLRAHSMESAGLCEADMLYLACEVSPVATCFTSSLELFPLLSSSQVSVTSCHLVSHLNFFFLLNFFHVHSLRCRPVMWCLKVTCSWCLRAQ